MSNRATLPTRSRAVLLAAAALAAGAEALRAAAPISPPVVEYRIQVRLDEKQHLLDGSENLTWRNPSSDPVSELRFHLYLNAFKNNSSTFMRESGGQLRGDRASTHAGDWGWVDVLSIVPAGGSDLRPAASFIQPDGNDPSDQTVLSVPLPAPVPPHGSIELTIVFRSRLPKVFARTGFVRDFHLVGQWFPKIGVYEPAGMRGRARGGWNCHAFHANSEFYADYGNYDVTFDVPSSYVVGSTGRLASKTVSGPRTSYRYLAGNVHDFAWTADPRYRVHEFHFDPARDVPPGWAERAARELGMPESEIALKPVFVRVLIEPEHLRALDRYVRSTKEALSFYGLWYGAYPYETLTVVDPPEDGLGAGGMEYPTFITGLAPREFLRWPLTRVRAVEDVVVHEFGHQYWYGMVGSNEFEESWLDEGMNSDSEYREMQLAYGPRPGAFPGGVGFDMYTYGHIEYHVTPNIDPILRRAWEFASGQSYAVNSYPKVALFMAQLRNDLGVETFSRAERAYFQEWSFRHPSTADFFRVFERVSGRDLSTYRDNLVEGTARLDWSVVSAVSRRAAAPDGVFDRSGGRVTLDRGQPVGAGNKSGARRDADKDRPFSTVVLFGNRGDWAHASTARLAFEDGRILDRDLPADAKWVRLRITYKSPLAWATVDPERRNAWEWDRANDSKVIGRGRGPAATKSRLAAVKYAGWTAYLSGLLTQLLWALA
jgi:hypothetical protein